MRSHLLALLATLLAAAAAAAPAQAVETGVNQTMNATVPLGATAAGLGADWVRMWVAWHDVEPLPGQLNEGFIGDLNRQVEDARGRGVKVLMIVHRTPAWANGGRSATTPPSDPATFGRALGTLARVIPGVQAWEIWNEQDGPEFFAGGPDPGAYAALLKAAHPAIKAAQPHDLVVSGGMVGNNMDFLEALYAHGAQGSFDAVGVHTDTACLTNGPDVIYRDEQGRVGRYTFTGYREVHAVMSRHGDGAKPIWMTELGWNTQDSSPGSCNVGMWAGQKPLGVDEAHQAEYLTQAYRCLQADPFVQTALWFGLQDIPGSAHAAGYGLYRADRSAKPAAAAFRALDRGIEPKPCGGVVDTSGPEIVVRSPTDGAAFKQMFELDVEAVDVAGGVGVRRLEIYADGRFERSFGDGVGRMGSYWPSHRWPLGRHRITFKAEDKAGNRSVKTITVRKVKRLPKVRTRAALALEHVDARTVRVTGGVTFARASAAAKLRGRAHVVFKRRARGGWRTAHRIRARAGRPVSVTKTLARGRWRVHLDYPGVKGFRKSRSAPVAFRIG